MSRLALVAMLVLLQLLVLLLLFLDPVLDLGDRLRAWPSPGIHHLHTIRGINYSSIILQLTRGYWNQLIRRNPYMMPVSGGARRQLLPALNEQHTSIADLPLADLVNLEAFVKVALVTLAIREAGTGGFGAANAAALQTAVDFRLVETEHFSCPVYSV